MINKRFFISWIASSIVMFALSYLWHGVILNDLSRLTYPREIFLVVASVVYLIIGLIVTRAFISRVFERIRKKLLLKGLLSGSICGFVIFLISVVTGVSFSSSLNLSNIALDMSWQMIEQSAGGIIVSIVHMFVLAEEEVFD